MAQWTLLILLHTLLHCFDLYLSKHRGDRKIVDSRKGEEVSKKKQNKKNRTQENSTRKRYSSAHQPTAGKVGKQDYFI